MYSSLNALAEQQASTLTFFFFRYWVIFAGVLRITDMFHDVVLAKVQLPDKLGSHRGVHDQLIFFTLLFTWFRLYNSFQINGGHYLLLYEHC